MNGKHYMFRTIIIEGDMTHDDFEKMIYVKSYICNMMQVNFGFTAVELVDYNLDLRSKKIRCGIVFEKVFFMGWNEDLIINEWINEALEMFKNDNRTNIIKEELENYF